MSWKSVNIEMTAKAYQAKTANINILEDLRKEQSRLCNDFPICSLLIDEALDRFFSTGILPGSDNYADILNQRQMKLVQKVLVPINKYKKLNTSDKLLESNDNSITNLQNITQCKILVKGRSSMLDHWKEKEHRQSGNTLYFEKEPYVEISTVATPVECFTRIAYALKEVRKFILLTDKDDDNARKELSDTIKVKSEVSSFMENIKCDLIENISIAKRNIRDLTITNNIEHKFKKNKLTEDMLTRNLFEKKRRFPGIFYIKDKQTNKIVKREITNRTALNRCLKRSFKEIIETEDEEADYKPYSIEYLQQKPTELVFENTPRDIIISLLEIIKNYPILWQFHDKPFNEDYTEAIEDVCQIINVKWSLNTNCLQMQRSINRIIRFYRFLYPFENIEKFSEYFDKCALFLPSTAMTLPHARCTHCFICYKEDLELRRHLIEHSKSLRWPHKCPYCAEIFKDNDEYEFHKRLPHFMEIFTCEQCNERFSVRYKYNYHIAKHQRNVTEDPRNHVCDECGKAFRTSGELRSHKYYHEEKKFKCHLCPKAYFKSPSLLLHLKRHRNQLDIICEVCGKGFLHHRYLNDHMETHNGAQISCNICNLKLRRSNLLRHLRTIHVAVEGTIESTFRAKGHRHNQHNQAVKRAFNSKYGRTKRSKRSEEKCPRQYVCKSCNINFGRLKFLKDHNKEYHDNLNRLPCKICDSQLAQKQNLRRHYREKHKLHDYQSFLLVDKEDDINVVLAMTSEDLEKMSEQCIVK